MQVVAKALFVIFVLPFATVISLIAGLIDKPIDRSRDDVAKYIREFLDGTGSEYDWDDFVCVPIKDQELDEIREIASELSLRKLELNDYKQLESILDQLTRNKD